LNIRRYAALLLSTVLELAASQADAQPNDDKIEARARFQAGLTAAQRGDLVIALSEFEAAYAAQPHFSVLYNIGRARAGLGRYADAIAAFERYLAEGGSRVAEARRAEVRSLLDACRNRIGAVQIDVAGPDAFRIWLDGEELRQPQLGIPIPLSIGTHTILQSTQGSAPVTRIVNIQASTVTKIEVTVPTTPVFTDLRISCNVPGVEIFVDGAPRGRTPVAVLKVAAGNAQVSFVRPGYRPVERHLRLESNKPAMVDCDQRPLTALPAELSAVLKLRLNPSDAGVFVDGMPFSGAELPSGPHVLSIFRDGYVATQKRIVLIARRATEYSVTLDSTPSAKARRRAASASHRRLAYVLGGVGAGLLAASAGVYYWNGSRYDDWRTTTSRNLDRALSIQRFDDLALGLLLGGIGLTTGGVWLYLTPPP
jgi:hypothetical protein